MTTHEDTYFYAKPCARKPTNESLNMLDQHMEGSV